VRSAIEMDKYNTLHGHLLNCYHILKNFPAQIIKPNNDLAASACDAQIMT